MSGHYLAAGFAVSGAHGWCYLIAFLLFAAAGIVAWFVAPRAVWATLFSAGAALFTLAQLITG